MVALDVMLSSLIPKYDAAVFSGLHEMSTYLPQEENYDSLKCIMYVVVIITIIHIILLQAVKVLRGKSASSLDISKSAYQVTNLLVNLTLGCLGIYYQIKLYPYDAPTTERIAGYEHVKIFSVIQIGYQLWALPVGIIFVGETTPMIIHHVSVCIVASTTAFVKCGFRYYSPYFYGLIEISSVPLSIMNSFKNNKQWIKDYPEVYSTVRLVFGVTFLLTRVIIWTPWYSSFFSHACLLWYSGEVFSTKVLLGLFIIASLVLTFLQYFWASKIVSAMVKKPKKKDQ